jgi:hypothetical protein
MLAVPKMTPMLAEAQRTDPFLAVVAQDELAATVVADFEDRLVDLDAHLEPVEGLFLRRRPTGRPRTGGPAARETEGSHPQLDGAPVAGRELAGHVLLVGSQVDVDDCLSLPDWGEDRAAGLRGPLPEGALDLGSYLPEIRERVRPLLHDEPAGVTEAGAQRGVMLGDIAGERGDDTNGRLVVEPHSRPGPWVLLPVAGDELDVTSQRRVDRLPVAEIVEVVHGVLSSPAVSG